MSAAAWTKTPMVGGARPVCSIIAAATLFLCLFTPYLLLSLPVMVTVGLSIAAAFRRERPTWLPYVVGGLAVALVLSANNHSSNPSTAAPSTTNSELYKTASWEYGTEKDEMRGEVSKWATLKSPTDLNLSPPYDGENTAELTVWSSGGEAVLSVTKGQFTCRNGDMLSVKFDYGPVYQYRCREPDNGNSNSLYISSNFEPLAGQPASMMDGIAKAKKVTIEVPFYQDGSKQLTFNVAGLDRNRL